MAIIADSIEETYRLMQPRLDKLIPDVEIRYKAELVYEINRLKKERGANRGLSDLIRLKHRPFEEWRSEGKVLMGSLEEG